MYFTGNLLAGPALKLRLGSYKKIPYLAAEDRGRVVRLLTPVNRKAFNVMDCSLPESMEAVLALRFRGKAGFYDGNQAEELLESTLRTLSFTQSRVAVI